MWETRVQFLGWEDPLEQETATHSSTLAGKIPWTEKSGRLQSPWGRKESDTTERLTLSHGRVCPQEGSRQGGPCQTAAASAPVPAVSPC